MASEKINTRRSAHAIQYTVEQAAQLAEAGEHAAALAELYEHLPALVDQMMSELAQSVPQKEIAARLGITQQAVSKRWPRRS